VTPDLNHAITDRRVLLRVWWRSPRYRAAVERLKEVKPFCERCTRPTTTALHSTEDYPKGYEHYVTVVENLTVPAGCQRCNREELRNKRPCPECVKAYQQDPGWSIRYIPWMEESCFVHLPQLEQDRIRHLAKLRMTAKQPFHPCGWHRSGQRCLSPIHFGPVCDRSKKTACGCDYFMERVVAA
jgi:hypothetical protein